MPPHGNMQHYIESLRRMLNYKVDFLAPGHGDLIGNPRAEIEHLIAHRLKREAKVADALTRLGTVDIDTLVKLGLIPNAKLGLKVLGTGDLKKKLTVVAAAFSATAKSKIEAAGGSCSEPTKK